MTETRTRHEDIVTPSSSLLRTVVSTMGTLTFTSVASFYYYYYRQNATPRTTKNIGVVLFQSVASLWGWPQKAKRQRSLSPEKRRKKSKSPGRRQRETESSNGNHGDHDRAIKEIYLNEHVGIYDVVPDPPQEDFENDRDCREAEKDVCLQLFEHREEEQQSDSVDLSHPQQEDVICEDASDEECSECNEVASDSAHEDEDLETEGDSVAQGTKSAYGIQEDAFHFTAPVVENSTPSRNLELESINSKEFSGPAVAFEQEVPARDDEALVFACLIEESINVAQPPQEVTITDDLSNDANSSVSVHVADDEDCMPANEVKDIKDSSQMVNLDEEQAAFAKQLCPYEDGTSRLELQSANSKDIPGTSDKSLRTSDDESIAMVQEEKEEPSVEEDITFLERESSMIVQEDSAVKRLQQVAEVIEDEASIQTDLDVVVHEDHVSDDISKVVAPAMEVNKAIDLDTEHLTSEVDGVAEDDVEEPTSLSFSYDCICEEDPALVSDDEVFQCDVESDHAHDSSDDDDASSSADFRERHGLEEKESENRAINCIVEGNPVNFCAHNSIEVATVKVSSLQVDQVRDEEHDKSFSSDIDSRDLPKIPSVDDDVPAILQLDTHTYDDTTVTEDGGDTDSFSLLCSKLSESPTNSASENNGSRRRNSIRKMAILLLSGGVLLGLYSWNNAESRVLVSEPVCLANIEDPGIVFEMNVANTLHPVVSKPVPVEIESPNVSIAAKDISLFEFVPVPVLPSVQIELLSEASSPPVRRNLRRKLSEMSKSTKPALLGPHGLYFETLKLVPKIISAPLRIDFRQMLSNATLAISNNGKQAALGPHGLYFATLPLVSETTVLPGRLMFKQVLSVIRSPMKLSESAKEAFMVSHGIYPNSVMFSPVRASIKQLLSKIPSGVKVQTRLKQVLSTVRSPMKLSETAKEAFMVSQGIYPNAVMFSPVRASIKQLLSKIPSGVKVQTRLKQVLKAVRAPMKLSETAKEAFMVSQGVVSQSLIVSPLRRLNVKSLLRSIVSPITLSGDAREAVLGSHGLYKTPMTLFPEQIQSLKLLSMLLVTSKEVIELRFKSIPTASIQRHLEEILVMASSTIKLSKSSREAFMGSHGLYSKETMDLSPTKAMIEIAASKLFETLQRALLGMYLDLLIRVPEQRIVLRYMTISLANVAGQANSDLRKWYSESLKATASVSTSIKTVLVEASSTMKLSNETKQSVLGFHGQYFEHHDYYESNTTTGDRQMLFIELWSTLTSCSYFLDHSVVLWGKVGDEIFNRLDHDS